MGAFAFASQTTSHSLGLLPIVLDFDCKLDRWDVVGGVHFAVDGHASFNEVDPDPL